MIVIQADAVDTLHETLLVGLRRYRDRHDLRWQIHTCALDRPDLWPQDAWWLLRRPSILPDIQAARPDLRFKMPFCSIIGTPSPDIEIACTFAEDHFGRLAAEHLAGQGYRRTCTIAMGGHRDFSERRKAFTQHRHRVGLDYRHYTWPAPSIPMIQIAT